MKNRKPRIVEGQVATANALKVDAAVIKLARSLNADGCLPGARYDIAKLRRWIAKNEALLKAKGNRLSVKKEQKISEEIRKLRIANDAKEKLVILKSEVASKARELGEKCTALLYAKFVNELPTAFSNDVTSNRVLAQNVVNQVVAEIASFGSIWAK